MAKKPPAPAKAPVKTKAKKQKAKKQRAKKQERKTAKK